MRACQGLAFTASCQIDNKTDYAVKVSEACGHG